MELSPQLPPLFFNLTAMSDSLAALRADFVSMKVSSQNHLDAVVKVTRSMNDSLERKLKAEIDSSCQKTASRLASLSTAVDAVKARDVSLGKRVAKLIKVCVFFLLLLILLLVLKLKG